MQGVAVLILFVGFVFAAAALVALPLMLFLGNIGINLSFWGTLPGAVVLGLIGGSSASSKTKNGS